MDTGQQKNVVATSGQSNEKDAIDMNTGSQSDQTCEQNAIRSTASSNDNTDNRQQSFTVKTQISKSASDVPNANVNSSQSSVTSSSLSLLSSIPSTISNLASIPEDQNIKDNTETNLAPNDADCKKGQSYKLAGLEEGADGRGDALTTNPATLSSVHDITRTSNINANNTGNILHDNSTTNDATAKIKTETTTTTTAETARSDNIIKDGDEKANIGSNAPAPSLGFTGADGKPSTSPLFMAAALPTMAAVATAEITSNMKPILNRRLPHLHKLEK